MRKKSHLIREIIRLLPGASSDALLFIIGFLRAGQK